MNFNQLQYFIILAREKNFSRAAEKLYISQPSLSQSISLLEEEFGVKFFERKPFKLTYAGEIFLRWAEETLSTEKQMRSMINDIAEEKKVRFSVGISPYRSLFIIPPVIEKFKKEYPQAHIIVEEYPTDILQDLMNNDKLDLLIDVPNPDNDKYESILIKKEKIYIGIPKELAEFSQAAEDYREVDLKLFANTPFILLTENQYIGSLTRKLCQQSGFIPQNYIECHNIETVQAMISKNLGVSLIPEFYAKYVIEKDSMLFAGIKDFKPARDISIIYNRKKYMPKSLKYFIRLLREEIINL